MSAPESVSLIARTLSAMSLEIQQREHEGIIILDLKGRLNVGQEATTFRERMQKLLPAGLNSIILNMEHVDYVDSTGLGALVMCFTSVQKAGRSEERRVGKEWRCRSAPYP